MPSNLVSQTAQATTLSIASNVLAQIIASYRRNTPLSLNLGTVVKFALFSIVSNPPNVIWQTFLEDHFPTNVPTSAPVSKSEKTNGKPHATTTRTSKRNVLRKFLLDQTIGAVFNTLMFLVFIGYVNAKPGQQALDAVTWEVKDKFWPIVFDGFKVWPFYSLISFLFIPVDKRVVMGCLIGVGWNIYLSLAVA